MRGNILRHRIDLIERKVGALLQDVCGRRPLQNLVEEIQVYNSSGLSTSKIRGGKKNKIITRDRMVEMDQKTKLMC